MASTFHFGKLLVEGVIVKLERNSSELMKKIKYINEVKEYNILLGFINN